MIFPIFSFSALIIYLAFFFAGIIDAVCGGGGLLTLSAFMLSGFPVRFIFGTNQMSCTAGSFVSFLRYAKRGLIDWPAALAALPFCILGGLVGAHLNLLMPTRYLQIIMVFLIPFAAVIVLMKKNFGEVDRSSELSRPSLIFRSALIGLVCGVYQGFYGAASGTFFMLGFALLDRLDLVRASGTTKCAALAALLTGAFTYALSNVVYWPFVGIATIFSITGSYVGADLAMSKGARLIRPMFTAVLFLLTVRIIWQVFL